VLPLGRIAISTAGVLAASAATAHAQLPPLTQPQQPVAPLSAGTLSAPKALAAGVPITVRGRGATPGARVEVQVRLKRRWASVGARRARPDGRYRLRFRPRRVRPRRLRLRAVTAGAAPSPPVRVRLRHVTLAAVGDINLGDGVAAVMAQRGYRFPWGGTARMLRRADIAFGNLECAVSLRGSPVPKQYNFRGRPGALRAARRYAGMDVFNLANNHVGDFGTAALLDTLAWSRRFRAVTVGAGRSLAAAARPRVVRRLGLKVAFVGISDVVPPGFAAGPASPGTTYADPGLIRSAVRRARRRAHVVVATFHWGIERATSPSGRQRFLAGVARRAGAHAVIGAHPHVLQPVERRRRKVTAYSLGNFVWAAGSPSSAATGILRLRLSARGVEGSRLARAVIVNTRARLLRR
jgi:poly-gamma-glutamate synthesis protein (capsule biosynthesis protein)